MKTYQLIFAGLLISSMVSAQKITEILGRPTNTSITVSVLVDSPSEVYFEYGATKGIYTGTTAVYPAVSDSAVEALITGLLPATRYYYRTRYRLQGASTYLASEIHTFITQRTKGTTFRFTVESDPHPYDKKGNWQLFDIALQNQLSDTADFMIDMGDTFGDDHYPTTITSDKVKSLQLSGRDFFGKVCHSMPFFFCIGNHEGESGYYLLQTPPNNLAMYETQWRKRFYPNPYPNEFYTGDSIPEGNGVGLAENYYAWEWGDALFVVLDMYRYASNSEKPQKWDFTIGKSQYDWFKRTLENSKAQHKFVFAHHVLGQGRGGVELATSFEWGGYDAGTYKFDSQRPGWGLPLHQLMKKNKVDIFFQGHDHIYVRQMLDSMVYQSVPMPSDSSYKIGVTDNGDAYLSGKQLAGTGHLRVTVAPDSVRVDFVNSMLPKHEKDTLKNRQIRDSYAIRKQAGKVSFVYYNNSTAATNTNTNPAPEDTTKTTPTDTTKTTPTDTTSKTTTWVTNIQSNEWRLFPNPASDEVYLLFDRPVNQNIIIQIINLEGKLLYQTAQAEINEYGNIVNLKLKAYNGSNLKSGIYIMKVIVDNNNVLHKTFIVK